MCELLLLSSSKPTNATLSLAELCRHGGITGPHVDQEVVLVASVPLTDEAWAPLAEGEVLTIAAGRVLDRDRPG